MPRVARFVAPGLPHHVTQRGNDGQRVFHDDADRSRYLTLLNQKAKDHGLSILGFCLMTNHVHLIVIPPEANTLAKAIGRTHLDYTNHFNARHGRGGHLWQNRFFSCLVVGPHLWRALRYVDLNPVRAGLVRKPWHWRWSSAEVHAGGADDFDLLDMERWREMTSGLNWRDELSVALEDEALDELRGHTQTGRPLADESTLRRLELQSGRSFEVGPVGRPFKRAR